MYSIEAKIVNQTVVVVAFYDENGTNKKKDLDEWEKLDFPEKKLIYAKDEKQASILINSI